MATPNQYSTENRNCVITEFLSKITQRPQLVIASKSNKLFYNDLYYLFHEKWTFFYSQSTCPFQQIQAICSFCDYLSAQNHLNEGKLIDKYAIFLNKVWMILIIFICEMSRYEHYQLLQQANRQTQDFADTVRIHSVEMPRGFIGNTWDAKHLTNFMTRSNYSNWRGEKANISRLSQQSHKRTQSMKGQHFFRTTKDNRNQSLIGYTPIFPLVTNGQVDEGKTEPILQFLNTQRAPSKDERVINGKGVKLRCSLDDEFKFQGNAVKYQLTDPLTLRHEDIPMALVTGFQKERMNRLINKRHPHGMTGIDHPQNPQSKFYDVYEQNIRIREEPNSHRTFLIDRDWNEKKRSVPPVDLWKRRTKITVRKFRNEDTHGYNIVNNRRIVS